MVAAQVRPAAVNSRSTSSSPPPAARYAAPQAEAAPPLPGERVRRVGALGFGAWVPEAILTNDDLARMVDTSDEWVITRTGIRERRKIAPGEAASDLGLRAALAALESARVAAEDVELLVVATSTPDTPVPATACHLQRKLGAARAAGFDLGAGCTGFVAALMSAHRMLAAGAYRNALVVSAEVMTAITDYGARETCVLFGDGAGAVLLEAGERGHELVDHRLGMDGTKAELIEVAAGGSLRPACHESVERKQHFLTMQGREVFRFAASILPQVVRELLARHGLEPADVRLFVAHQANLRILEAAAKGLDVPMERFVVQLERYGNTSSASVPIALAEVARDGRLEPGDLVVLVAFGAGVAWGASLLRW